MEMQGLTVNFSGDSITDGLHSSDKGHVIMAEVIVQELLKLDNQK